MNPVSTSAPRCVGLEGLDDEALGHVAGFFRALADPVRLRIVGALRDGPRCVTELTELIGCSQPNVSKHLKTLVLHGLVVRDAHPSRSDYRIAAEIAEPLCALACDRVARQLGAAAELSERFARRSAGPPEPD